MTETSEKRIRNLENTTGLSMFEVEEVDDSFVYVWDSGSLDELQAIIDHYRELGFNKVWYGYDNSTLCLQKIEE